MVNTMALLTFKIFMCNPAEWNSGGKNNFNIFEVRLDFLC